MKPARPMKHDEARSTMRIDDATRCASARERGRAAWLVLLLSAALLALGIFAFGPSGGDERGDSVKPDGAAAGASGAPSATLDPAGASRQEPGPTAIGAIQAGPPGEWESLPKVFDGTGRLIVDVRTPAGVAFPAEWTLHIEPSQFAEGRRHAETRTRTFTGGERSVEEIDLPMAAYRVYVSAPGMASLPQEVVLHRIGGYEHLPGVDFVRVSTTLFAAGTADGVVLRANGLPAAGLRVLARAPGPGPTGEPVPGQEAVSGADGRFRFEGLAHGDWLLLAGDATRPLVPPVRFAAGAGATRLAPIRLPELVDLELVAVDHMERPLPNAELSGYRAVTGSGSLRGVTGPEGILRVDYLQPGPWRFEGVHEELGLSGRHDAELRLTGDGKDGAGPDGVQRVSIYLGKP